MKDYIKEGWTPKEPLNLPESIIDKRSEWTKIFTYIPITFEIVGKYTVLCLGMMFYDPILKALYLFYLTDKSFLSRLEIVDKNKFSIEYVMDLNIKRISNHKSLEELIVGDTYFGKGSLGSSFFAKEKHSRILTKPENLKNEMFNCFKLDSMLDISIEDYKFYKIEEITLQG